MIAGLALIKFTPGDETSALETIKKIKGVKGIAGTFGSWDMPLPQSRQRTWLL